MKHLMFGFLSLLAVALPGLAQTARPSRPRVVATPTPAPPAQQPVLKNDPGLPTTARRPPVLTGAGGVRPTVSPTPPVAPTASDDGEEIKVETNLVTMPVTVLDRDGRFVSGLTARDFQVFENGTQQKVEYFQSVEQPFSVILMIDVSPSTAFRIDEIHDAASRFVAQLRPSDRVMVIAFDDSVRVLSRLTSDRRELEHAIRQAQFGDGTSLYEAVDRVLSRELRQIEGRKAVVLFSDGVDTTSEMSTYQSTLADAEEADALFYTIRYNTQNDNYAGGGGGGWGGPRRRRGGIGGGGGGSSSGDLGDLIGIILGGGQFPMPRGGGGGGGRGQSSGDYETGRRYLEELSRTSGGRTFEGDSYTNLEAAFAGIAEELRRQYSVGYYPEQPGRPGDRKQIRVRVNRPNLVVKAKTTYIVGQSGRGTNPN